MDAYSHLLTERIIYLGTSIDAGVANTLIAQLLYLESNTLDAEVPLYINCEGGDPSAMLAIYGTMKYIRPPVATTCVGQTISVGAVLLAAGVPGKRSACSPRTLGSPSTPSAPIPTTIGSSPPARTATSTRVSPRSCRTARSLTPSTSRQSGSRPSSEASSPFGHRGPVGRTSVDLSDRA